MVTFKQGTYDKTTGQVLMRIDEYPPVIAKMVKLHKATTDSPLYFLNLFFGASLLFFAVSAFFMFVWKLPTYKTGLKFAASGICYERRVPTRKYGSIRGNSRAGRI